MGCYVCRWALDSDFCPLSSERSWLSIPALLTSPTRFSSPHISSLSCRPPHPPICGSASLIWRTYIFKKYSFIFQLSPTYNITLVSSVRHSRTLRSNHPGKPSTHLTPCRFQNRTFRLQLIIKNLSNDICEQLLPFLGSGENHWTPLLSRHSISESRTSFIFKNLNKQINKCSHFFPLPRLPSWLCNWTPHVDACILLTGLPLFCSRNSLKWFLQTCLALSPILLKSLWLFSFCFQN